MGGYLKDVLGSCLIIYVYLLKAAVFFYSENVYGGMMFLHPLNWGVK